MVLRSWPIEKDILIQSSGYNAMSHDTQVLRVILGTIPSVSKPAFCAALVRFTLQLCRLLKLILPLFTLSTRSLIARFPNVDRRTGRALTLALTLREPPLGIWIQDLAESYHSVCSRNLSNSVALIPENIRPSKIGLWSGDNADLMDSYSPGVSTRVSETNRCILSYSKNDNIKVLCVVWKWYNI